MILAEYARDNPAIYGHSLLRAGGSTETLHQLIRNTTNETVASITNTGARVLMLDSIYTSSFDPLDCLSRATFVHQCTVAVPAAPPISDHFYKAAAAANPGSVFTFSINHIMCPGRRTCAPMVGGIPVWRNVNHYTTQILTHFHEQIWHAITASGAISGLSSPVG